jgi:hypothetical protein
MKRLSLLAVALFALAFAVPVAETAPTSEEGCTVEHVSGDACQGPDLNPAANSCNITTWVRDASCELTVADGVANNASGFVKVFSELQQPNWHAEFHLVVRDKATGEVLFTRDGSNTRPLESAQDVPNVPLTFGAPLTVPGGSEVICEVTGTHTPAGAALSAQAALEGFGEYNNVLRCAVS